MEEQQYDSKDIYLLHPKSGEIIGLHAIGEKDGEWIQHELDGTVTRKKGFMVMEQWGNPYDKFLQFTGNSFRVFEDLDKTAMEFINDGWVDLDTDKVHQFNDLTTQLLMHKYFFYEKKAPVITDQEYDAKEREWIKLGMELGLPILEYPNWKERYQHNRLFWRAKQMAEEYDAKSKTPTDN